MSLLRRPLFALASAWAMFLLATAAPLAIPDSVRRPWMDHAAAKTALVVLALIAMRASGAPWSAWGFRRGDDAKRRRSMLRGAALGAAASTAVLLSPARGMTWLADLGMSGIVGWIWLHSSVTEEIFVRGWFQRFVDSESRVALSAALFGSMHLMILSNGADFWTLGIIVTTTTALGFVAAQDRERTGALGTPIATHIAFNVGGFLAGVVVSLVLFAATGQKPIP